jgi:hypothetical protein
MNNGGTLEYGIVNIAGGNDLSETGLISTTAISAAATAANVVYSNTSRSNLPYRVVEIIQSTQATAGTWITAPTLVQGVGGNAATAVAMHASGSAPIFACRAWAVFNGTTAGTNAPTAGGNITSITRNAAGSYTANITNALPDANYSVAGTASSGSLALGARTLTVIEGTKTATSFSFFIVYSGAPTTGQDNTEISFQIFR